MHTAHFYFSLKKQLSVRCKDFAFSLFFIISLALIVTWQVAPRSPAVSVQKTAHTVPCGLFWEDALHSITISPVSRGPQALLLCLPPVSRAAHCLVNSLMSYLSPSNAHTHRKHRVWRGLCSPPSPCLNHPLLNHRSSFITQIKRHRPARPA